jgi:DnaA family protein
MTTSSQLTFRLALPSHFDFNHFVAGNNQEALSMLLLDSAEHFIALWGHHGSGKTHLLKAWIHQAILNKEPALYIDACNTKLTYATRHAKFLAIDHIEALDAEAQIMLFSLYNLFRSTKKHKLLIACTLPPIHLKLREDLRSRILSGLVYEIHGLSDEQKLAALDTYARAQQINIHKNVLRYLLRHFQRNLTSLTTIIDTLDREALAQHHPITLPFLKTTLSI